MRSRRLDWFFLLSEVTIWIGKRYFRLMAAMCRLKGHDWDYFIPEIRLYKDALYVSREKMCHRCGEGRVDEWPYVSCPTYQGLPVAGTCGELNVVRVSLSDPVSRVEGGTEGLEATDASGSEPSDEGDEEETNPIP